MPLTVERGIDDDGQYRHNSFVHLLIEFSNGESIKLPEEVHHVIMLPINRIHRSDVLREAWKRVRRNKGAAGVDAQTLAEVEQSGTGRFLEEIGAKLGAGKYRPQAVRRRCIPKPDGRQRGLDIPTVRHRVVQMAAKLVMG